MSESTDVLTEAQSRATIAKDSWNEVYTAAREDLDFLSDAEFAQWDDAEATGRVRINRPVQQIDQLSQFVHQVSNDIRMNTPTIKVIPASMEADPDTAEAIMGRIKAIEYKSNADAAYDMAADFSVKSSIGFIRIDHGYANDDGFEQELRIHRVVNPLSAYIDPNSVEPDGSDAKYGFLFDTISKAEFQKKWPDAAPVSFGDEEPRQLNEEDQIVIAEYFRLVEDEQPYGLLSDGTVEPVAENKKYKSTRNIKKPRVERFKLAGQDVLEEGSFPGKYIPLVPVYGEEAWNDGKRHIFSLIRKSKSAQMMYNLWKSLETELLLKQQQAPVQAAVGQMRGFEDDWKDPAKAMVLYYHQTDANNNQAPPPQRLQPTTIPTGIVNAARETVDDIKATMGLYNASIGNRSNETSGIAIQKRQQEGDVATFHFGDNLVRSITQVGKILVCALPEIEDSKRIVQIITKEDEPKMVGINGAMVEGQEKSYDFTKAAKYDVRVITGASFTTQRQEAALLYADVVKTMPDLMPVIGDLVFKYQDAPGAQAISNRLKKLVDPKLLDEKDREGMEDAQQAQIQAIVTELQGQIQALQAELQSKQADYALKQQELQIKNKEAEIKAAEVAIKAQEIQKTPVADVHDQSIKEREMQLKEAEFQLKVIQTEKQKTEEETMGMSESIETLQARLNAAIVCKQEQDAAMELALQQKAEAEALEAQKEEQERLEKQAQSQALLQGLMGIQQTLGALVQSVNQPIEVVRDEQGNLIGAK